MSFTDSSVVPYGLLVMHAMDIYRQKTCPPAPFPAPSAPTGGGTIIGYIMGTDTVLPGHPQFAPGPLCLLGQKVCYGTVVRRGPTEVVLALRGTDGFAEWIEDGEFLFRPYAPPLPLPLGTSDVLVEQGFWGIYDSLLLTDINGAVIGRLAENFPSLLETDDTVVVAGHSLGAPLATYLTLDLARDALGQRVLWLLFRLSPSGQSGVRSIFRSNGKRLRGL